MSHETPPNTAPAAPTSQPKRTLWIAALCVALLTLCFYRHLALSNRILSSVDAFAYFYPYRDYAAKMVGSGHLPLWNPYLFLGAPFLANPQAAVFYPLNLALFWLSGPEIVSWSIVIHTAIAAFSAYLYARQSGGLSAPSSLLAACAFAFGGFLSGQAGHVNQLDVSAWFPLLLLAWDRARRRGWRSTVVLGAILGLGLLAGHTQSSFISLVGLGLYALLGEGSALVAEGGSSPRPGIHARAWAGKLWAVTWRLGAALAIAALLSAIQLLPTLELSGQSIRSGGLSYREAIAFSLKPLPRLLWHSFFPPWGRNLADVFGGDYYTEYLAYIGVVALGLAAAGAAGALLRLVRNRGRTFAERVDRFALTMLALGALGLLLALGGYNPLYWVLYKVVPGFQLFRAPARWLLLYAFAAAMLAGAGMERFARWPAAAARPRIARIGQTALLVAVFVELLVAAQALPTADPTAPEAFTTLRTAPAHILAAQEGQPAPGRFLSLSDIAYDPGDLADVELLFRDVLSPQAIYDYIVCLKRQEILAPNLPLAWRVYAVDGYDGGVLPLDRYISLQRLFLPEDRILVDGRLREGLERIPPARLLAMLGVQWVITDKVKDAWIDDVFYDLAFSARLSGQGDTAIPDRVSSEVQPHFVATALGVVSFLEDAAQIADGTPVAEVEIEGVDGSSVHLTLRAGVDTAESSYTANTAHRQARIGLSRSELAGSYAYVTRVRWDAPIEVSHITVSALSREGQLAIQGAALIDERDGSSVPVLLSTDGRYRQVHSGDVKVYEVLDTLPRAYVVHRTRILPDTDAALTAMADPEWDPGAEAILAEGKALDEQPEHVPQARVEMTTPEAVSILVSLDAPGYLVLSDSWYPGWEATVDGQPAAIERANVAFRAIYVPAGDHTVVFEYRPASYRTGLLVSLATLFALALSTIALGLRARWTTSRAKTGKTGPDEV